MTSIRLLAVILLTALCIPANALQLQGRAEIVDAPKWIPAYASTNDELVGPYQGKRRGQAMSDGMLLHSAKYSKTDKYWPGPNTYRRAKTIVTSISEQPGAFYFCTIGHPDGPRGWYQDTGRFDEHGYRLYRIWFDYPDVKMTSNF